MSENEEKSWESQIAGATDDEVDGSTDPQLEAPAEPVAEATPAPADQPPPVPTSDGSVPAPAETPAPDPVDPTPTPITDTPHAFRADGTDLPIPGVTKAADGSLRIPAEAIPHLQNHLANRRAIQERERLNRQELQAAQAAKGEREVKADLLLGEFAQLLQKTPEERYYWLQNFEAQLPLLEERAQAKAAKAELERYKSQAQPVLETQQWESQAPIYQEGVQGQVQNLAGEFPGLDVNAAVEAVGPWLKELIVNAPEDIPEAGLRKGDPAVNLQLLRRLLGHEHRSQQAVSQARAQAQQDHATKLAQAKAAQINASVTAPVKAPPVMTGAKTVARTRVTTPARDPETGKFVNKASDWDDEYARLKADDLLSD